MTRIKHRRLRAAIVETCRGMNRLGINQGTSGNVSARTADGFLLTPSGMPYDRLAPKEVVEMDLDGGYLGELLPSSEWRMHLDIYRRHADAGAVVHVHPTYCTSLACIGADIPAFHYMVAVAGGHDIRCARYATFGTQELSDNMALALEDRRACLLANHGMICFGDDLEHALWLAEEVETLARQYWHARLAGKPRILRRREMDAVISRFATYGKQTGELADGEAPAVDAPRRRDGPGS